MTIKKVTVTLEFSIDQETYGQNTHINYADGIGRIIQGILSDDEIKSNISDLLDRTGYPQHKIEISGNKSDVVNDWCLDINEAPEDKEILVRRDLILNGHRTRCNDLCVKQDGYFYKTDGDYFSKNGIESVREDYSENELIEGVIAWREISEIPMGNT